MGLQQQPPHQECRSEVALLLWRIEQEYTAADRGLNGLSSGTSQHEVMTAKMERMSDAVEALKQQVGPDTAMALTVEIMNRVGGEPAGNTKVVRRSRSTGEEGCDEQAAAAQESNRFGASDSLYS